MATGILCRYDTQFQFSINLNPHCALTKEGLPIEFNKAPIAMLMANSHKTSHARNGFVWSRTIIE
eukprot:6487981-Amphidinium_carterae.1